MKAKKEIDLFFFFSSNMGYGYVHVVIIVAVALTIIHLLFLRIITGTNCKTIQISRFITRGC